MFVSINFNYLGISRCRRTLRLREGVRRLDQLQPVDPGRRGRPGHGVFSGFVWSENIGCIRLSDTSPVAYQIRIDVALTWSALGAGDGNEAVRGSLSDLRNSGGDHTTGTDSCASDHQTATSVVVSVSPEPPRVTVAGSCSAREPRGQGHLYLGRAVASGSARCGNLRLRAGLPVGQEPYPGSRCVRGPRSTKEAGCFQLVGERVARCLRGPCDRHRHPRPAAAPQPCPVQQGTQLQAARKGLRRLADGSQSDAGSRHELRRQKSQQKGGRKNLKHPPPRGGG